MTKKITLIVLIAFFILTKKCYSQTYYVAPGGSLNLSSNILLPGDIQFTIDNCPDSSIVYVKSGIYNGYNLIIDSLNYVKIIGYNNIPGDLDSSYLPNNMTNYKTSNYDTLYPTIIGNDRKIGVGVHITKSSNLIFKNFQIKHYEVLLRANQIDSNIHENIICAYAGDTGVFYSGKGAIYSSTNKSLLKNFVVYNPCAEGFVLSSNSQYNHIKRITVWSDDNSTGINSSLDYYLYLAGVNVSYNIIEECYLERDPSLAHGGHGLCALSYNYLGGIGGVKFNTFRNCTTYNVQEHVLMRGPEVIENTFEDNYGYKACIRIDASMKNHFNRIHINRSTGYTGAVQFTRHMANGWYSFSPNSAKHNNFNNCLFTNVQAGIEFSYWADSSSDFPADSNHFKNCNFINTDNSLLLSAFLTKQRSNTGNTLENCIIYGFKRFETPDIGFFPSRPADLEYINCNIFNNGFNISGMTGTFTSCQESDPLFVNISTGDYKLKLGSPCIDSGININLTTDYFLNPRIFNGKSDIGFHEFSYYSDISESIINGISIFPNPTSDYIFINSNNEYISYEIYSSKGTVIYKGTNHKIDLRNFTKGTYLIKIFYENKTILSKKIIKN